MPFDGLGTFTRLPGTTATPFQPIDPTSYNSQTNDIMLGLTQNRALIESNSQRITDIDGQRSFKSFGIIDQSDSSAGTADQSAKIQTALDSGLPIFSGGMTVYCDQAIHPKSNGIYDFTGTTFIKAFRSAGTNTLLCNDDPATPIENVYIKGGRFRALSNSSQSDFDAYGGGIVFLNVNDSLIQEVTVSDFMSGVSFFYGGNNNSWISNRIERPDDYALAQTLGIPTSGGARFFGGKDNLAAYWSVHSNDDALQAAPVSAVNSPAFDQSIENLFYVNCRGRSDLGRGAVAILVNVDADVGMTADLKNIVFQGCKFWTSFTGVSIENRNSIGKISGVSIKDCDIEPLRSPEFSHSGVIEVECNKAGGTVENIEIKNTLIRSAVDGIEESGQVILSRIQNSGVIDGLDVVDCTLEAPELDTAISINLNDTTNVRVDGNTITAPASADVIRLASCGLLSASGNDIIDLANGQTALRISDTQGTKGARVELNKARLLSTATDATAVALTGTTAGVSVDQNDFDGVDSAGIGIFDTSTASGNLIGPNNIGCLPFTSITAASSISYPSHYFWRIAGTTKLETIAPPKDGQYVEHLVFFASSGGGTVDTGNINAALTASGSNALLKRFVWLDSISKWIVL